MKRLACSIGIVASMWASSLALAATHPAVGYTPVDLSSVYNGGPNAEAHFDYKDIVFLDTLARWSDLSQIDQYILAGVEESALKNGPGLRSWGDDIFQMVSRFYDANGYIPEQLKPALIQTANKAFMSPEMQDVYRNPFTGTWPRLNPTDEYQPGDVVIRPLTLDEMKHFAELNPHYKDVWFGGRVQNVKDGGVSIARLRTKVYYIRVYGSKAQPIESGFKYIYSLQ